MTDGEYSQPTINIRNTLPSSDLLFRVQTTSPLSYRVKPSHGRIPVGESVDIQVIMVADSKKADKFLIRCAPVDHEATGEFADLVRHFM